MKHKTPLQAFAPNCKHILLDSAHSARRILSRPWENDVVLDRIMQIFCHGRHSPAQLISHSTILQS
eukprot:1171008-Prorocentrum_lima.AAC.1